jgi:enoyl-CoA hydratase/carnithine racemase
MSENLLQIEQHKEIEVIKLSRGVINSIDMNLVQQLTETLEKAKADPKIRGLILSSANDKFFSIGFDIPYLYNLTEKEFASFYHSFNSLCLSLYTFPKPTIAALTGHAIAGGCILALCCDQRLIAEGRRLIGLNEIKLGVPVPFIAECILRQIMDGRIVRQVVEGGGFYAPFEALRIGLVDESRPYDHLLSTAIEKISQLTSNSPNALAAIKQSRTMGVEKLIETHLKDREKIFIQNWFSEEARKLLKDTFSKF